MTKTVSTCNMCEAEYRGVADTEAEALAIYQQAKDCEAKGMPECKYSGRRFEDTNSFKIFEVVAGLYEGKLVKGTHEPKYFLSDISGVGSSMELKEWTESQLENLIENNVLKLTEAKSSNDKDGKLVIGA